MKQGWCKLPLSHIFSMLAASYAEEDYVHPSRNSIEYNPRFKIEIRADATRTELFEFLAKAKECHQDNSPVLSHAIRTRLQRETSAEARPESEVRIRQCPPSQPGLEAETIPTWMEDLELDSDDPNSTIKIKIRLPRSSSPRERNVNVTPESKVDAETTEPGPEPRRRYPSKGMLRPKVNCENTHDSSPVSSSYLGQDTNIESESAEHIIPSIEVNTPTPPKSRGTGSQSPRKRQRVTSSDSHSDLDHPASGEVGTPGVGTPGVGTPGPSTSQGPRDVSSETFGASNEAVPTGSGSGSESSWYLNRVRYTSDEHEGTGS